MVETGTGVPAGQPDTTRIVAMLERAALFKGVPPEIVDQLAPRFRPVEVAPGEVVVRQGEGGDELFLVEAGELEASVELNNKRVRLGLLRPGDVFGEMTLLRGVPRTATVTALGPSRLWSLSSASLREAIALAPSLGANLRAIMRRREVANALRALQ